MSFIERRRAALFGIAMTVSAVGCTAPTGGAESPSTASEPRESTEMTSAALVNCGARYVNATGKDTTRAGAVNDCRTRRTPCATVQHGVDAACAGDTVNLARGSYAENVVVAKSLTLTGPRAAILRPALSAPNPCTDGSLCAGTASNIILVRASGVTVKGITLDGDNPALTSGVVVGGADIDARNGIVTDYLTGRFDSLDVENVHVQNVYLRGIYAASGGSFTFNNVLVSNVLGDAQSVGIFNFGGAGTISNSEVDDAADAITANHSTGTVFSGNTVRRSASGIHTDNAGDAPGSTADRIENNQVLDCSADGIGAWVFVPFVAPQVTGNTIQRCAVGLAAFGQGAAARTSFTTNTIVAGTEAGTVGAFISTDQMGFGEGNVSVLLSGNVFRGNVTGVAVEEGPGFTADAQITCNTISTGTTGVVTASTVGLFTNNAITGNTLGLDATAITTGSFDAQQNYWGCAAGPGAAGCDTVDGSVDTSSPLAASPACAGTSLAAAAEKWEEDVTPSIVSSHGPKAQAKRRTGRGIAVPGGSGSRSQ